jgi:hypothetical protein
LNALGLEPLRFEPFCLDTFGFLLLLFQSFRQGTLGSATPILDPLSFEALRLGAFFVESLFTTPSFCTPRCRRLTRPGRLVRSVLGQRLPHRRLRHTVIVEETRGVRLGAAHLGARQVGQESSELSA